MTSEASTIGMKTIQPKFRALRICHSSSGFRDYVGADGSAPAQLRWLEKSRILLTALLATARQHTNWIL
jgi:hypothetical protein